MQTVETYVITKLMASIKLPSPMIIKMALYNDTGPPQSEKQLTRR